jgi:hypothetical protein
MSSQTICTSLGYLRRGPIAEVRYALNAKVSGDHTCGGNVLLLSAQRCERCDGEKKLAAGQPPNQTIHYAPIFYYLSGFNVPCEAFRQRGNIAPEFVNLHMNFIDLIGQVGMVLTGMKYFLSNVLYGILGSKQTRSNLSVQSVLHRVRLLAALLRLIRQISQQNCLPATHRRNTNIKQIGHLPKYLLRANSFS